MTERCQASRGHAVAGSALVATLWTIGILSMLIVSFAFDAHLQNRIAGFVRSRRKAEALAFSGMELAFMLLEKQRGVDGKESPDLTRDDRWYDPALTLAQGQSVRDFQEPLGDGRILLTIEPEPARRNVNRLRIEEWERILEICAVPEDRWPVLIDSFFDWTDPDDMPRLHGAETEDYYALLDPPYRAKNGPLDTVRELLLVRGFSEAILSGGVLNPEDPEAEWIRVLGVQDLFTTYGDGRVNVNAAGERVLRTLPGVDDLVARAILEERGDPFLSPEGLRQDNAFESVEAFMQRIPGLPVTVREQISVRSETFRVFAEGRVGRARRRIRAIVQLDRDRPRVLQWQEDG